MPRVLDSSLAMREVPRWRDSGAAAGADVNMESTDETDNLESIDEETWAPFSELAVAQWLEAQHTHNSMVLFRTDNVRTNPKP